MTIERLEELKEWFHDVAGRLVSTFHAENCYLIDYLIEAEIDRLEKGDAPVDCLEDLLDFTYFNARESYQEVANIVFEYLDAKGVNNHLTNTCEWCNGQFDYMVVGHDEKGDCYQVELEHKYCPNCGRAIDWSEEDE